MYPRHPRSLRLGNDDPGRLLSNPAHCLNAVPCRQGLRESHRHRRTGEDMEFGLTQSMRPKQFLHQGCIVRLAVLDPVPRVAVMVAVVKALTADVITAN